MFYFITKDVFNMALLVVLKSKSLMLKDVTILLNYIAIVIDKHYYKRLTKICKNALIAFFIVTVIMHVKRFHFIQWYLKLLSIK